MKKENGKTHPPGISGELEHLHSAAQQSLRDILEWWERHMTDRQNGGYYGRIDGHGRLHPEADKGVILNARILWTFSAAARYNGTAQYHENAERAFRYFSQYFHDEQEGGVYWMLDYQGKPVQTKKQVYAQAFAIYALSEYYLLTRDPAALERAQEIFWLLEQYSLDRERGGYFEAFSRDWQPLSDLRLSEKDANEAKTMNTHLHVLEAYTALFRATRQAEVGAALKGLIWLFLEKFVDPDTAHLRLFFDEHWALKSDHISFGHDIEAAWLLCDAADALGDASLSKRTGELALRIAAATLREGIDPADGGLWNEAAPPAVIDRNKDWWPQAEAVVGFLYAWKLSGNDVFAAAAIRSWQFIETYLVDRAQGEWFWALRADGQPDRGNDKAGPWKCPYHNGRACMMVGQLLAP